MIALLTFAAICSTLVLLTSASATNAKATAHDEYPRGSWGIASWNSTRRRPLNPHERRWQTSLLASKKNESRWRDLVAEMQRLERLGGVEAAGTVSDSYDQGWIEASLANLERAADRNPTPGETT